MRCSPMKPVAPVTMATLDPDFSFLTIMSSSVGERAAETRQGWKTVISFRDDR